MRIVGKVLYWLAVLAISLALLVVLMMWFESRDSSEVEGSGLIHQLAYRRTNHHNLHVRRSASLAKATIR